MQKSEDYFRRNDGRLPRNVRKEMKDAKFDVLSADLQLVAESGTPVTEVCQKMGIVEQTFYRWKKKYIGMGIAEVRRLKILDQWAYLNGVELDRPGKPTDNALIEAFNGRFRQECLNENWFLSLEDAMEKVEEWRQHYNWERPHGSLGNMPPFEFAGVQVAK